MFEDRNAVGRLISFSPWMWWENTQDPLHSVAARQKRSHCNMHRGDEKGHRRDDCGRCERQCSSGEEVTVGQLEE